MCLELVLWMRWSRLRAVTATLFVPKAGPMDAGIASACASAPCVYPCRQRGTGLVCRAGASNFQNPATLSERSSYLNRCCFACMSNGFGGFLCSCCTHFVRGDHWPGKETKLRLKDTTNCHWKSADPVTQPSPTTI